MQKLEIGDDGCVVTILCCVVHMGLCFLFERIGHKFDWIH